MKAESSEIAIKALLSILIIDTLDFLNVGKNMNDRQIAQTIDLILEDYSVYKIDYFVLCFNKAKKGYFGKLYDRVDGQVILDWIRQHDLDYQLEIEQLRQNEKIRLEKDRLLSPENEPAPMPDNIKELIKKVSVPADKKPELPKSENQLIVDGLIAEFDTLHKSQDDMSGGKRYVKYDGKMLDIAEFINLKLADHE